jgi:hypothetical protein
VSVASYSTSIDTDGFYHTKTIHDPKNLIRNKRQPEIFKVDESRGLFVFLIRKNFIEILMD